MSTLVIRKKICVLSLYAVTWHKGDRELMYSQRHRIIMCGTLHTMEIPQVMALDKGEYIVKATNIYGTIQSSCYVNILPKG